MSEKFLGVCRSNFIKYKPVAPGQPQADGMVERVNKTLSHIASIKCAGDGTKWANYVGEIEYALNTRRSSVTKFTPYELVYGRLPPDPVYTDLLPSEEGRGEGEGLRVLRHRIAVLQQLAHENQMMAAGKQQSFHDAHAERHTFQVGDTVYHYKPSSVEKGVTSKLAYRWEGPYTITRKIGEVNYTLSDKNGKALPGTVHARQLYKPLEEKKVTTIPSRRKRK